MLDKVEELKQRIKNTLQQLTENQKTIANYILENPRMFALSSIRELEKALHTSKSTIVRLAQTLGYKGFQELRSALLESVRKELDPIHSYKTMLAESSEKFDYLKLIAKENINNINDSLRLIDTEQYKKAIQLIENANYVYTMGMKMSSYLAEISAYLLNRVSINSGNLVYSGLKFTERIINMSEKDVILAFSFHPYSPETVEAACYAQERNIPVIVITDILTNEIIQYSSVFLQVSVKSSSISNSICSAFVLVSSIAAQIGYDLKTKTLKTIDAIDHIREEHTPGRNK